MSFSGFCQLKALIPDLQDRLYKDLLLRLLRRLDRYHFEQINETARSWWGVSKVHRWCVSIVEKSTLPKALRFNALSSPHHKTSPSPIRHSHCGHRPLGPCSLFTRVFFSCSFWRPSRIATSYTYHIRKESIYSISSNGGILHFSQFLPDLLFFCWRFMTLNGGFLPQFDGISTSDDCTKILCNDLNQGFAVGRWSMFLVNV